MRANLFSALVLSSALVLTNGAAVQPAFATGHHTQLSQCMHNALIGAGVGAAIGALRSNHNRLRGAAIGGAVGGLGTYGVCRLLTAHDQRRVENDYDRSLRSNSSVQDNWDNHSVQVARPTPAPDAGSHCRRVSATMDNGQQLPPETFCRNSSGQWVPA